MKTKLEQIEEVQMEFGNPGTQFEVAKLAGLSMQDLFTVLDHYDCGIVAEFAMSSKGRELATHAYIRTFFCLGVLAERRKKMQ